MKDYKIVVKVTKNYAASIGTVRLAGLTHLVGLDWYS